jgi:hypothetical protein
MNIGLRGKTIVDAAFFYAPYIPLSMKMSALGLGFTKPKYNFSRAKWYEVTIDGKNEMAATSWCEEQFGRASTQPDAWTRWHRVYTGISPGNFRFRDEKDYILFTLRWS